MSPGTPEHLFMPHYTNGQIMISSLQIYYFVYLPLAEGILRNPMQSHKGCSVGQLEDSFQSSGIP